MDERPCPTPPHGLRGKPQVVEVSSVGPDATREVIGSTPYAGDTNNTGLRVPVAPSVPGNRYLFRLCGFRLGAGYARLVGIRQYASIGAGVRNGGNTCTYPVEREIVAPMWAFTDGNISWHLRSQALYEQGVPNAGVSGVSGMSNRNLSPCLLDGGAIPGVGAYVAPGGGAPPSGAAVGDLGTFRDLRFPWRASTALGGLAYDFEGPCDVVFYASVKQTNPETRCVFALPAGMTIDQLAAVAPEDAFVAMMEAARVVQLPIYWRVAGALLFEVHDTKW